MISFKVKNNQNSNKEWRETSKKGEEFKSCDHRSIKTDQNHQLILSSRLGFLFESMLHRTQTSYNDRGHLNTARITEAGAPTEQNQQNQKQW